MPQVILRTVLRRAQCLLKSATFTPIDPPPQLSTRLTELLDISFPLLHHSTGLPTVTSLNGAPPPEARHPCFYYHDQGECFVGAVAVARAFASAGSIGTLPFDLFYFNEPAWHSLHTTLLPSLTPFRFGVQVPTPLPEEALPSRPPLSLLCAATHSFPPRAFAKGAARYALQVARLIDVVDHIIAPKPAFVTLPPRSPQALLEALRTAHRAATISSSTVSSSSTRSPPPAEGSSSPSEASHAPLVVGVAAHTVADAEHAVSVGADFVVLQSSESGAVAAWHARHALAFGAAVRSRVGPGPLVLLQGGVEDGAAVAAALVGGVDGVMLEDLPRVCLESGAAAAVKATVRTASGDDTVRSSYGVWARVTPSICKGGGVGGGGGAGTPTGEDSGEGEEAQAGSDTAVSDDVLRTAAAVGDGVVAYVPTLRTMRSDRSAAHIGSFVTAAENAALSLSWGGLDGGAPLGSSAVGDLLRSRAVETLGEVADDVVALRASKAAPLDRDAYPLSLSEGVGTLPPGVPRVKDALHRVVKYATDALSRPCVDDLV